MTEAERATAITSLLASAVDADAELERLEGEIRRAERRAGAPAEQVRREVKDGVRAMTSAVCDLLMFLAERDRLRASLATRSG